MNGCAMFVAILFGVGGVVVALQALRRIGQVETELDRLRTALDYLGRRVSDLRVAQTPAPEPAPVVEPPPAPQPPAPPPPAAPPAPYVVAPPPPPPPSVVAAPPQPPPPRPVAPPPVAPPPPFTPPPVQPPQPSWLRRFDWEGFVGVKLFSWIAGIAIVLATIFFLKYSVEHGWLSPSVRAVIGLLTGATLLAVCELRVARDYKFTVNALDGAGIAVLYATLFAMHALWHLVSAGTAFGVMLIVTAVAVGLSIRRDSIFIALLGLVGGFSTPALLSTGENRPISLFGYLLLLNAGLAWVAYRKRWPLLTACSLVFTIVYQWAWVAKYLSASQLPLAAAIFAVFAIMASTSLWVRGGGKQPFFDRVATAGAALPLIFAVFAAAVPAYGARIQVLFGFLLLMAAGLAVVAATKGPRWLHLLGGVTVLVTFVLWFSVSFTHAAYPAILGWVSAFVLLYLGADFFCDIASPVAGVLAFAFPVLIAIEPRTVSPALAFGVLFVLLIAIAAHALARRAAGWFIASLFTIAAEAIWSGKHLAPERLYSALTLYLVFALYFLAVPALGRRFGRELKPSMGVPALLLLSLALLFFLSFTNIADVSIWPLALMIAVLNVGIAREARAREMESALWLATIGSWLVIGAWWAGATLSQQLPAALLVTAGFTLLTLVSSLWADRGDETRLFGGNSYLALVGHFFLFYVATQKLMTSPWPVLAVLFVLDVALVVAALYGRRGMLLIGAALLSQLVLVAWALSSGGYSELTMSLSVLAIPALCFAALFIVRRLAIAERDFALAVAVALFAGQLVTMAAKLSFATALTTQAILLAAILVLAAITEWHVLAVLAVGSTALVSTEASLNSFTSWEQRMTLSAVLYALFILNPLLLGGRAKRTMQAHLAAVLAGVPFFFIMRGAMGDAGLSDIIGALPVAQAVLMVLLLWQLLRIEPPGERLLSRLALVAAASLAFVTVAIPLQLEKQWITIGWALEAAALVWLFTRIPHRGLLAWSAALFAAVFVRLVLNPDLLAYHPVAHMAIINWYLYTYLVAAASFFAGARLLPNDERARTAWAQPALNTGGTVLLFCLVNIEIADYFSHGPRLAFNFFSASLGQDLTYTIAWAVFAVIMLVTGIAVHSRAARVAAIVLLLVTVLKCFLHDLASLGGLYRVGSLLGLALSLLGVGVLLQRFVRSTPAAPQESAP